MERRRYENIIGEPGTFKAVDHLSYAEVNMSANHADCQLRKGTMTEKGVLEWLEKNATHRAKKPFMGLRILACTSIAKSERWPPLALSLSTYEAIEHHWKLPQSFIYLLINRTSYFSPFQPTENGISGHAFQTVDKGGRPYTCAFIHDAAIRQTHIFLHGLPPHQFAVVCEEISMALHIFACPTLVPMCLIELVNEAIEKDLNNGRNKTHEMMNELGMTKPRPGSKFVEFDLQRYDFLPNMRALTGLRANLAKCEMACEVHLLLLDELDEEYLAWLARPGEGHGKSVEKNTKSLQRRSERLKKWMLALKPRTRHLTERSQAYVQTVYSLMAQKDSELNMRATEASLRISEASYRDSAAMIALAEDSKQVALATSRDSSSMFVISALTLIFLPATFTASLFSTEFFDLRSTNVESITSSRFWLYWAVTVPLTVVTAASAAFFWKMRDTKLRKKSAWRGAQIAEMKIAQANLVQAVSERR